MENELTNIINSKDKDLTLIFEYLKKYNILIPIAYNKIIIKHKYILLFTQRDQIKDIKYESLKRTKLEKVIKEIYNEDYKGIIINPSTGDFILEKELINIYLKYLDMIK